MQAILDGIKIVSLAVNVPGPVAAWRLAKLGAEIIKVEPPQGDPLKQFAARWYADMVKNQKVVAIDLKSDAGRQELDHLLADTSLLLTSFRPSALQRLQLNWEKLHAQHKQLCLLNIIGYPSPEEEIPGHDLNYQARLGLLTPPFLPVTLHADLAGAERAVSSALALLLSRERTGVAQYASVSLYEALHDFTGPLDAGLTKPGGILGGGLAFYQLYRAADGWVALAALEPSFVKQLNKELRLDEPAGGQATQIELERIFRTRTAHEWEQWAAAHDLPIAAVL
jgi:alpha-methylacyl-CoA racemase